MINKISLENFKCWKSINDAKFGEFTGFFGTNSSGKTSIIQFFLMLKQTIESADRNQVLNFGSGKDYVQLGSFFDIITLHEISQALIFRISLCFEDKIRIFDTKTPEKVLYEDTAMEFGVSIEQSSTKRILVNKLFYQIARHRFMMYRSGNENFEYDLNVENLINNTAVTAFKRMRGKPWPLPEPVKFYGFPDQVRTYYQNTGFLFDLQLEFEKFFSKVFYLGPLREYPRREYKWAGAQPDDMGQRGERFLDALLVSRERGDKISRGPGKAKRRLSLEEYIAYWLKELELISSFEIQPINGTNLYKVLVKKNKTGPEVLLTDVGFGVSQILPVLTLCYYVPEGSTLLIEQPEIHLHPKAQAGLADVFIDAIKVKRIQIILESHSEHLLRRLQLRIAEELIRKDSVSLYFCENTKGYSELVPLELDLYGKIINWPENFFGDEMGEMIAMNDAMMKRKNNT